MNDPCIFMWLYYITSFSFIWPSDIPIDRHRTLCNIETGSMLDISTIQPRFWQEEIHLKFLPCPSFVLYWIWPLVGTLWLSVQHGLSFWVLCSIIILSAQNMKPFSQISFNKYMLFLSTKCCHTMQSFNARIFFLYFFVVDFFFFCSHQNLKK